MKCLEVDVGVVLGSYEDVVGWLILFYSLQNNKIVAVSGRQPTLVSRNGITK